ncbi:bifunctional non-homologous end joining protein LigD [Winogradskyella pacifica]|uniref:Bifunctional non-homologous end joining protein LigD n=1 Tax=Winogradskyella pacifica TaxID=664642 RepID=A0A3D9LJX5_9FLAO|nr:non-homologous end-joining DNA ligase [Winogradskyella pacifica]REE07699.1 bifunctional non-homologous end joining protein LigD [Winogradskyella pacifica]
MNINTQEIKITHKDKVLFPESGITKNDLILYYDNIANYILPYLKDRPLTMQRFPKGIGEEGFFQKNAPDYFPKWIPIVKIKKMDGWVNHVVCNSKETLLYLINQNVLSFHVTLSKVEKINHPDKLVFDLDPPKGNFKLAVKAAKALRFLLEEKLELNTYVMTSGSEGLHIVIPIKPNQNFDVIHNFTKTVANYICNNNPTEFTTAIRKNKREGRLYIDFLRNSYAQTSVVPYSIRAIENAPVATTLHWNELNDASLNAQYYTMDTIFKRLETIDDPWKNFEQNANSIDKAINTIETLIN